MPRLSSYRRRACPVLDTGPVPRTERCPLPGRIHYRSRHYTLRWKPAPGRATSCSGVAGPSPGLSWIAASAAIAGRPFVTPNYSWSRPFALREIEGRTDSPALRYATPFVIAAEAAIQDGALPASGTASLSEPAPHITVETCSRAGYFVQWGGWPQSRTLLDCGLRRNGEAACPHHPTPRPPGARGIELPLLPWTSPGNIVVQLGSVRYNDKYPDSHTKKR